jgi:hypothetical protein
MELDRIMILAYEEKFQQQEDSTQGLQKSCHRWVFSSARIAPRGLVSSRREGPSHQLEHDEVYLSKHTSFCESRPSHSFPPHMVA